MDIVDIINKEVEKYISQYYDIVGCLPANMQLKHDHTQRVVENISLIADFQQFSAQQKILCKITAMLHDIGRYEQLQKYRTFSDAKSVDHAELSYQISKSQSWLQSFSQEDQDVILTAIRLHNKRDLPADLSGTKLLIAQAIRDADKIDILKVIEDQLAASDWREHSDLWWNLPIMLSPSKHILDSIEKHETPRYVDIKSLVDFLLVQLSWISYGMNFESSKKICFDRKHFEFRVKFLDNLVHDNIIVDNCAGLS